MAFTDAEKAKIRLHAGYPSFGNQYELESVFFGEGYEVLEKNRRLEFALNNLTVPDEIQARLLIVDLDALRAAWLGASDNLDTEAASVWRRNATEVSDRAAMYRVRRIEFCQFINVPSGPGVGGAVNRRVRC